MVFDFNYLYNRKKKRFSFQQMTHILPRHYVVYMLFLRQVPAVYILPNDSISIETHATNGECISLVFMKTY